MPRSQSPPPRPREDRERDRDRPRDRSRSPPRGPKRTKEFSFYKKSSGSGGGYRRDPLADAPESERERFERRDRGEVPARFGGTREHGVRNTMSATAPIGTAPTGIGSLKRSNDPLDRMPVKGAQEGFGTQRDYERDRQERDRGREKRDRPSDGDRPRDGDRQREERVKAMEKGQSSSAPPAARPGRFIEVIANDRMGRKVRIKCLPTDTVGDLKKLIAAQTGTTAGKIQLKKWYTSFKDHVTLQDYEINDGMSLEMY